MSSATEESKTKVLADVSIGGDGQCSLRDTGFWIRERNSKRWSELFEWMVHMDRSYTGGRSQVSSSVSSALGTGTGKSDNMADAAERLYLQAV